jgi:hypothetical protein
MAALNWTDESGIERRAVFYQMNGALLVSQAQGTSQTATWTQINISAQLLGDALNPRTDTPLAAAATPWQAGKSAPWDAGLTFEVTLYYINEGNQVCQLSSNVGDLSTWQGTEVFISSTPADQSQLSAVGYYCGSGCLNAMCAVFQGDDGILRCACGPNAWANIGAAYVNSPVAIVPFASAYGTNVVYDSELAVLYLDGVDVNVLVYNHGNDQAWDAATQPPSLPLFFCFNGC